MILVLEVGSCSMGLWICSIGVGNSNHGWGYDLDASLLLCYLRRWSDVLWFFYVVVMSPCILDWT
jgi:hypothetical protein